MKGCRPPRQRHGTKRLRGRLHSDDPCASFTPMPRAIPQAGKPAVEVSILPRFRGSTSSSQLLQPEASEDSCTAEAAMVMNSLCPKV
mmetsp:Transcript_63649/g.149489  ORF Transcript_63649/g.149489 Transcript_63649/m.149489 type:complete len:87 (+) Transcript_63649:1795-2055(+)